MKHDSGQASRGQQAGVQMTAAESTAVEIVLREYLKARDRQIANRETLQRLYERLSRMNAIKVPIEKGEA